MQDLALTDVPIPPTFLIHWFNLTPLLKKDVRFAHYDLLLKETLLKPVIRFPLPGLYPRLPFLFLVSFY